MCMFSDKLSRPGGVPVGQGPLRRQLDRHDAIAVGVLEEVEEAAAFGRREPSGTARIDLDLSQHNAR